MRRSPPRRSSSSARRARRSTTTCSSPAGPSAGGGPRPPAPPPPPPTRPATAPGAAVACPDRPVIALEADGSAMYTIQALWTQAREGLDVTTVIVANRSYAILEFEFSRVGAQGAGAAAHALMDIGRPELGFAVLAEAMGVPGRRVTDADGLIAALREALAEPGPHLIEAVV